MGVFRRTQEHYARARGAYFSGVDLGSHIHEYPRPVVIHAPSYSDEEARAAEQRILDDLGIATVVYRDMADMEPLLEAFIRQQNWTYLRHAVYAVLDQELPPMPVVRHRILAPGGESGGEFDAGTIETLVDAELRALGVTAYSIRGPFDFTFTMDHATYYLGGRMASDLGEGDHAFIERLERVRGEEIVVVLDWTEAHSMDLHTGRSHREGFCDPVAQLSDEQFKEYELSHEHGFVPELLDRARMHTYHVNDTQPLVVLPAETVELPTLPYFTSTGKLAQTRHLTIDREDARAVSHMLHAVDPHLARSPVFPDRTVDFAHIQCQTETIFFANRFGRACLTTGRLTEQDLDRIAVIESKNNRARLLHKAQPPIILGRLDAKSIERVVHRGWRHVESSLDLENAIHRRRGWLIGRHHTETKHHTPRLPSPPANRQASSDGKSL